MITRNSIFIPLILIFSCLFIQKDLQRYQVTTRPTKTKYLWTCDGQPSSKEKGGGQLGGSIYGNCWNVFGLSCSENFSKSSRNDNNQGRHEVSQPRETWVSGMGRNNHYV